MALFAPDKFFMATGGLATTPTTLWTPAAGKKFRVLGFYFSTDGANNTVLLYDGTGGSVEILRANLNATWIYVPTLGPGYPSALANNVLQYKAVNGNGTVAVWGVEE